MLIENIGKIIFGFEDFRDFDGDMDVGCHVTMWVEEIELFLLLDCGL